MKAMRDHKITNHRHDQDRCPIPSCSIKIDVTCSCGFIQGVNGRKQAKTVALDHLADAERRANPPALTYRKATDVDRDPYGDMTNYFESLYS